jgi:hypothetical protein
VRKVKKEREEVMYITLLFSPPKAKSYATTREKRKKTEKEQSELANSTRQHPLNFSLALPLIVVVKEQQFKNNEQSSIYLCCFVTQQVST